MAERGPRREYTAAERAEAVALAFAIGPLKAAKQLGIPPRTVAAWRSGERAQKELAPIIEQTREAMTDRFWAVLVKATAAVERGLDDPKQRLGDAARALEVLVRAHELLAGRATSNTAVQVSSADALTDDEAAQLQDWLRVNSRAIEAAELEAGDYE